MHFSLAQQLLAPRIQPALQLVVHVFGREADALRCMCSLARMARALNSSCVRLLWMVSRMAVSIRLVSVSPSRNTLSAASRSSG
jgi:hypothetical protein